MIGLHCLCLLKQNNYMAEGGNNYQNTPEFIKKLQSLIENYPEVINFSEDGTEVVIQNHQQFTDILPSNFRHSKWSSFIRQMNMYDFNKISRGVKTYVFVNKHFMRGNQANYHLIRRKNSSKASYESLNQVYLKQASDGLQEYGCKSATAFIDLTTQCQAQGEELCSEIKKQIEEMNKRKKNSEFKQSLNGIRQALQLIEESSIKFNQSAAALNRLHGSDERRKKQNHISFSESSGGEVKKQFSNLLIPKTQRNGETNEIMQHLSSRNNEERCNTLHVSPGCSFSSFNSCLN